MEKKHSGERKKDYIANLAVFLFAFIVIFEVLLVTWLPRQLLSPSLWGKELALSELIDLEDSLRVKLRHSLKFKSKWEEGEATMALDCMDQFAKYLRKYRKDLTRDNIATLYDTLSKFEARYNLWKKQGKYSIKFETINIEPILKKELEAFRDETAGKK